MSYYRGQLFPMSIVDELFALDAIVEGRYGGLLLGPSHSEGGIITGCLYSKGFCILSEVEGYEYVVNNKSRAVHSDELGEINNFYRDHEVIFSPPDVNRNTPIIDARFTGSLKYRAKFLILSYRGGEAIVNKHSTKKYLSTLNDINNRVTWFAD